jgi:hypothetical protein
MLEELLLLIDSLPPGEKKMPPKEPEPDGPGLIKDSKLEAVLRKALNKPAGGIFSGDHRPHRA